MADPTPSSSKRSLFSGFSSSTSSDSARPETQAGLIPSASASSSTPPSTVSPPMPGRKKRELQGWKHSAAGSIGGMAGAIVTSPFDVVKTRLQSDMFRQSAASSSLPGSSSAAAGAASASRRGASGGLWAFVDTVVLIRRIGVEEGWRALYKGLGPSLVGIIPARAINFYFYPTSKAYLAKRFPNAPTEKAGQTSEDSPLIHLSAAVIAGIMTATGTNPIWVVKTRLQLSAKKTQPIRPTPITSSSAPAPSSSLPGPIARSAAALAAGASRPAAAATAAPAAAAVKRHDALSMTLSIIRQEGLPGLYRGLSASYLGVSEGVIQWVLYERLKRLSNAHPSNPDTKQSILGYVTGIVGASGGAKAVASLITYPHEVVRTRLRQPAVEGRTKYTGLLQTLKLVAREEGMAGLYGGLTAHMFRVVPNAACMFLIYELVAERLGS